MKSVGAPRVAHRVVRSSQATPAAVDNSAPIQPRPLTLIYRGQVVQINRATSVGNNIVASHDRLAAAGNVNYDWQHYIDLVQRKPGALRNGAPFADLPLALQRLRQGLLRRAGGDRVMAQVLACVPKAGLDAVIVAVELVVESGALSAEHVLNVLARLNAAPTPDCVETALQLSEAPLANTSRYDSLRTEVMEVNHEA